MLEPGAVLLDKYRVDRVIGRGGMATVFAATHLNLDEPVAIKLLLPELAEDPVIVQRFVREARAAVRLKGEHVTRVHDVGLLADGTPYMVMELLVGIDLAELLKVRGMLSPPEAVDLVLQVCEALAEAHAGGIVHRDIKPSNLFVTTRPDGSPLVKVLDFGISKVGFDSAFGNLTQEMQIVGTPSYMSPEQLRGLSTVDARSDIWSLGIVLYRLLAGHRPFKADDLSAPSIQALIEPTPSFTVALPQGLEPIVFRCLAKEVDERFQLIAEVAFALAPYAADQRAATIIVERTGNIQRWSSPGPTTAYRVVRPSESPPFDAAPPAAIAERTPAPSAPVIAAPLPPVIVAQPTPVPIPYPNEPTTLGSSAAALYAPPPTEQLERPRRRGLVIGGVAVTIICATLAAVSLFDRAGGASDVQPIAAPPTQRMSAELPAAVAPADPPPPPVVTRAPAPPPPAVVEPAPAVVEPVERPKPRVKRRVGDKPDGTTAPPVASPKPAKPPVRDPLDTRI